MKLIITEKPDVTKQVKNAIAPSAKYIRFSKSGKNIAGYYEDTNYVICNSVGHCIDLKNPNEIDPAFAWDLDALPYNLPETIPTKISSQKTDVFKIIQSCFSKYDYDEIIIATDGDREGQNIWRKIRLHLKNYHPKKESRVWISEWTKEGIIKAFNNRFPNSEKELLGIAAKCREEGDWLWGMEGTVAMTKKYSTGYGKENVISVGRVMTPTLKFVVDRENEIKNFKPEDYYVVSIVTSSDEDKPIKLEREEKNGTHLNALQADELANKIKTLKTANLETTTTHKTRKCPMLYDGTTILQDMNARYGYSATETTRIIQDLYQKYILTTYPGTNDTQISEGTAAIAYNAFNNMLGMYSEQINKIKSNNWHPAKHVVTKKDLPHEAITPVFGTAHTEEIKNLSEHEFNVYKAICDRFIACFYPEEEYDSTTVFTELFGNKFKTTGKVETIPGWTEVISSGSKDVVLPHVSNGYDYDILKTVIDKKITTAPPRYTESSLLQAMKTAGKFVEDEEEAEILKQVEGLGTSRTRAAVLKNLSDRNYFEVKKKTIYPTEKGMQLFEILPDDSPLTSPIMTAHFEQMFTDIENGNTTRKEVMKEINDSLNHFIEEVKEDKSGALVHSKGKKEKETTVKVASKPSAYTCPICGKPLMEGPKALFCPDKNGGCGFFMMKSLAGRPYTPKELMEITTTGTTSKYIEYKWKSGKTGYARTYVDVANKKTALEFSKE